MTGTKTLRRIPLIAAVVVTVACGGDPDTRRHRDAVPASEGAPARVIVIGIDTLRSDHLSGYGYERTTSPILDAMVEEEGFLFENAYASASWTLPSMTSVFTSLQPPQHRVLDQGYRLDPSLPTLAVAFAQDGWLTGGFITHIYVSSLFGLDRGFMDFRELSIDWNFREGLQLRADTLNNWTLGWIEHHRQMPFFLYVHYFDPHWDYDPPQPYDTAYTDPDYEGPANGSWLYLRNFLPLDRLMPPPDLQRVLDLYDGEIAWTDDQIGKLFSYLKEQDLWDDTMIVVLSDHGEEFQEHGSVHHIRTLYEEVIRVPLLIKPPGGRQEGQRARITEKVRNIDIAPTILEMSGVPIPETFEGKSLVPLFTQPGRDRPIFAHTVRHESDKAAMIIGDKKIVYTFVEGRERAELYDLVNDPLEQNNLAESDPETLAELQERFGKEFERLHRFAEERGVRAPEAMLTEGQRKHLEALGYL